MPFATEAAWVTGKWDKMRNYLALASESHQDQFNIGIARALVALSENRRDHFSITVQQLRRDAARGLSTTNTASLQACHEPLLQFHVLTELEMIAGMRDRDKAEKSKLRGSLDLRLDAVGPFLSDKQYILGVRRAAMQSTT